MNHPYSAKALKGKDEQWLLEEKYKGEKTPEYEADKKRLASGEPLAYVIGYQPFLDLKIYLDSHPLIPRVETEWWTEQMLQEAVKACSLRGLHSATARGLSDFSAEKLRTPKGTCRTDVHRLLDLCAGSGAIGCAALAKLPNAQVYFGEIDPAHEATILKNIRENHLDESRTHICIGDLFEPFASMKFDIIAANPPYVPSDRVLEKSVADYEPSHALFAGTDGLDLIRRIATELSKHLAPGGEAWIEIDTPAAATAAGLFTAQGFVAEIRNDQYDKPRIVVVSFP